MSASEACFLTCHVPMEKESHGAFRERARHKMLSPYSLGIGCGASIPLTVAMGMGAVSSPCLPAHQRS